MFSKIFVFLAPFHCQKFGGILRPCAPIDGKSAFLLNLIVPEHSKESAPQKTNDRKIQISQRR
jgi:hypothetical protein